MLGIYLHIPFCARKCDYCDFFSVPMAREEVPHEAYLAAIRRQLEVDVAALDLAGREVATVYFGGGTPSLLPPSFFRSILESLQTSFHLREDPEVSCEVNPATVDGAWFREARAAGITRCSIGVQSFWPHHLAALGRIHTAEQAMAAIAEAQDAGFASVGIDLLYGIPGETMAELEEDLRTAMTSQTQHVSAYQLTPEEGTPLYERLCESRVTSHESREKFLLCQMRAVERMLARGGWKRYEISNFANPGRECRHNLNYWRYGEYLGLGAGATSFLHLHHDEGSPNNELRITNNGFARRFTQSRNLAAYLSGTKDLAESETIDRRTAMAEFCFLGLRTTEGIAPDAFEALFGVPFEGAFGALERRLVSEGLLEEADGRIALTPRGREISNLVFQKFLP